ncbi:hypothetical protein EV193_102177 [Herbihabitans rhizosphaerae]|uniref:Uncharacterized protein n=2 Tax=Herbihabitans rhizosphaerae TaxID=1872711 RepID=A0A4Q7L132_9PSEU|nr:hypothetical protein EV193_102177 [Herbihabitans rhizosphaerae]
MFTHNGIAVSAWVSLDSSCSIKQHVFADALEIEFGSGVDSLGLSVSEDMVEKLATAFQEASTRFRDHADHENVA